MASHAVPAMCRGHIHKEADRVHVADEDTGALATLGKRRKNGGTRVG
jgi:hypothetical protein